VTRRGQTATADCGSLRVKLAVVKLLLLTVALRVKLAVVKLLLLTVALSE
jgi:hypothetical protein